MFIYPGVIFRDCFNEHSSYNIPGGKLLWDLKLRIRKELLRFWEVTWGEHNTIYR